MAPLPHLSPGLLPFIQPPHTSPSIQKKHVELPLLYVSPILSMETPPPIEHRYPGRAYLPGSASQRTQRTGPLQGSVRLSWDNLS